VDAAAATAALAAIGGLVAGVAAGLGFRLSERAPAQPSPPADVLPEGVDTVLAVLGSSAVVLDCDLGIVKASPGAYAYGVLRRDALAVPELVAMATETLHDGEIRQAELSIRRGRRGERVLHVTAHVAPLGSERVLVLVEDRTQSQRVDDVRRDFVANVSHELKTPVGALSLLAEAVQDASDDPDAVRRFARRMQGESARLTKLVQEIIDLSRLQYDDPIDSPEPVEVSEVMLEALDRARVDAEANAIRMVAGGGAGLWVLGDRAQLVTALGNLVENAVAYSPDHTRVSLGARKVDDAVEISVTDQGIGIPDTEQHRIFERFYRVDPARSRKTGGTGLGLSIVKHVAAAHGGEVSVWSVPGAGSTFTLRLPALTQLPTAFQPPDPPRPAAASVAPTAPVPPPAAAAATAPVADQIPHQRAAPRRATP
jgi:two-component system sensor histidine kinase SenX3